MGKAYRTLGVAYWSIGDYDRSIELLRKGLRASKAANDRYEMTKIYNNLGTAYDRRCEPEKAIEWYEKCVTLGNKIGDIRGMGYGLSNAAEAYAKRNLKRAKEYTRKALKIFERLGEKRAITQCHLNYGIIYREEKVWKKAALHFEKAIKLAKEIKDIEFPSQYVSSTGKCGRRKALKIKRESNSSSH